MERRNFGFREIKLAATDSKIGTLSGYAAVFDYEDSYGDIIERGAFIDSLEQWKARGKLPPMLLQHGGGGFGGAVDMLPVGKWTQMEEDSKGLKVEGRLFALDTERGRYIYEGLREGVLDGLSIGFKTREYREGSKAGGRRLTKIDLWEVSIVTFPANDLARVSSVKTFTPEKWRDMEAALREAGLSRSHARAAVARFKAMCQCEAGTSESVLREAATPADMAESTDQRMLLTSLERFGEAIRDAGLSMTVEASSRVAAILKG